MSDDLTPDPIAPAAILRLSGIHTVELFSTPEHIPSDQPGKARISLGSIYPDIKGPLTIDTSDRLWLTELAWTVARAISWLNGDTETQELIDRVKEGK